MNPKEVRELWCEALESGEYKEGVEVLARDGNYCCLGVLADLAVKHDIITSFDGEMSDLADDLEPVQNWAGLSYCDGSYQSERAVMENSLAGDNDEGKSFKQIAEIIRSEPRGLLAKSMDESAK